MNKPLNQLELIPEAVAPPIEGSTHPREPSRAVIEEIIARHTTTLAQAGPDDFDWETDDSIVVRPRHGVAVYENRQRAVVIRTQNFEDGPQEDHFAYVSPEGLPAVIKALKGFLS